MSAARPMTTLCWCAVRRRSAVPSCNQTGPTIFTGPTVHMSPATRCAMPLRVTPYDPVHRQAGVVRRRRGLVRDPPSPRTAFAQDAGSVAPSAHPGRRPAGDLVRGTVHPAGDLRDDRRAAVGGLFIPSGAGVVWNPRIRPRAPPVLPHPSRPRPVLVGHTGDSADPSTHHYGCVPIRAPSDVCGVLSLGDRSGDAAAQLGCRPCGPRLLRDAVRVPDHTRGTNDGGGIRG